MRFAYARPAVIGLVALSLGACAQDPYGQGIGGSGVTMGNRAALGGGLGALAGAGTGLLVGGKHERRNALIGAGVGAIAGAAVGTYLDSQEQALRQDLAGTGATVVNTGEQLVVSLPQNVTFATDSSEVAPGFQPTLRDFAMTLQQYSESAIDVIGHTDDTGEAAYNQQLSERRAQSVAAALRNYGVQPARLAAYGYGETQPIGQNATPEGRAQNRRVEIVVTPLTRV